MGTPLGPKYIPYTYIDPLASGVARTAPSSEFLGFGALRL